MLRFYLLITFTTALLVSIAWATTLSQSVNAPLAKPTVVPSLGITAPRDGDVLTSGLVYHITWTAAPTIDRVWIGYAECATCLTWIARGVPNTGAYDWTVRVSKPRGSQFQLVILGYRAGAGAVIARSGGVFSVADGTPASPCAVQAAACRQTRYLPIMMR